MRYVLRSCMISLCSVTKQGSQLAITQPMNGCMTLQSWSHLERRSICELAASHGRGRKVRGRLGPSRHSAFCAFGARRNKRTHVKLPKALCLSARYFEVDHDALGPLFGVRRRPKGGRLASISTSGQRPRSAQGNSSVWTLEFPWALHTVSLLLLYL